MNANARDGGGRTDGGHAGRPARPDNANANANGGARASSAVDPEAIVHIAIVSGAAPQGGRLHRETAERICHHVARGVPIPTVCEAYGVDETLFRRLVIEDKRSEFRGILARAILARQEELITGIEGEVRGAIFLLERKHGWTRENAGAS